jgi:hypothetical protein
MSSRVIAILAAGVLSSLWTAASARDVSVAAAPHDVQGSAVLPVTRIAQMVRLDGLEAERSGDGRLPMPPWPKLIGPLEDARAADGRAALRRLGLWGYSLGDRLAVVRDVTDDGRGAGALGLTGVHLLTAVGTQPVMLTQDALTALTRETALAEVAGANVRLTLQRPSGGPARTVEITPLDAPVADPSSVVAAPLMQGGLHLDIRGFDPGDTLTAVRQELARGLPLWVLLDLRTSRGGSIAAAAAVAGAFLPEGTLVANLEPARPGASVLSVPEGSPAPYGGPLIVLVGGGTYSAAEILAQALQAHGRACVIGAVTHGKCIVQETRSLGDGWRIVQPVAEAVGPGGARCHEIGVRPDVMLPPSLLWDAHKVERLGFVRSSLGAKHCAPK